MPKILPSTSRIQSCSSYGHPDNLRNPVITPLNFSSLVPLTYTPVKGLEFSEKSALEKLIKHVNSSSGSAPCIKEVVPLEVIKSHCRAYNPAIRLGAYVYYAVAVIYDFAITSTSIFYLFKYKFTSSTSLRELTLSSRMSKVTRMMLYDGIGYFVALAAVNLLNLMLYKNAQDVQTAAASLGYSVSWIMSQRLLLHLYDASCKRRDESHGGVITVSRPLESSRQVSYALRTQFEQKSTGTFELSVPDFADEEDPRDIPDEIEVQVRVEHSVKLDRRLGTFELENYSRSITRCSGGDLRSRQS
ncbi:hypothetical protein H0H92_002311 [Tricholoma furcatifolium]|nr:hypothetical protein H0H92_002311 [Tricholoma furcatifolium]